ncbi:MAG: hypothetical protein GY847_01245 [Proteobacteria bacterium]|nr:hypothetical protein [Pseudomonadota bacterium]
MSLKTNKPIGVKLRRFLVDEVMPQLVRDGAYLPERKVVDGKIKGTRKARPNQLAQMREKRLIAKEQRMDRNNRADAVLKMANTLLRKKAIFEFLGRCLKLWWILEYHGRIVFNDRNPRFVLFKRILKLIC